MKMIWKHNMQCTILYLLKQQKEMETLSVIMVGSMCDVVDRWYPGISGAHLISAAHPGQWICSVWHLAFKSIISASSSSSVTVNSPIIRIRLAGSFDIVSRASKCAACVQLYPLALTSCDLCYFQQFVIDLILVLIFMLCLLHLSTASCRNTSLMVEIKSKFLYKLGCIVKLGSIVQCT